MKATFLNCVKLLIAVSTTLLWETISNTRGNDLEHSKNETDWTIRSQASKYAKLVYDEGSETTMKWR